MPEGPYVVTTTLTPADGSAPTTMNRNLTVDGTLGNMKATLKYTGKGATRRTAMTARFSLTRQSKVTVKIVNNAGATVATAVSNRKYSWTTPGSSLVILKVTSGVPDTGAFTMEVDGNWSSLYHVSWT